MKKFILILVILITSLYAFADTTYEVETKYGLKTVVVPDGQTTEDVMLILAKYYYELDEDYKSLQKSTEELIEKANSYMDSNNKLVEHYNNLIDDYDILSDKLTQLAKVKTLRYFAFVNAIYSFKNPTPGFSLDLGVTFFEKVSIKAGVVYNTDKNFGVNVGIGYTF